jgi:hypothetical protein
VLTSTTSNNLHRGELSGDDLPTEPYLLHLNLIDRYERDFIMGPPILALNSRTSHANSPGMTHPDDVLCSFPFLYVMSQ